MTVGWQRCGRETARPGASRAAAGAAATIALGLGLILMQPAAFGKTAKSKGNADKPTQRLERAAEVFHEIMAAPDKGIPHNLLRHSRCVMVVPGMKRAGIGLGGNFGRGVVSCRQSARGSFGAPLFLTIGGGSFGLQLGAQSSDIVLLILNPEGENYLLKDKFSLGGEMAATAGPVGRDANADTDALMHAKMLAYSRSRGLFGGITLNGAVIKQDHSANQQFYGNASAKSILTRGAPGAASRLIGELDRG
jgi:lipid-binding SYLF domain-containing protein